MLARSAYIITKFVNTEHRAGKYCTGSGEERVKCEGVQGYNRCREFRSDREARDVAETWSMEATDVGREEGMRSVGE